MKQQAHDINLKEDLNELRSAAKNMASDTLQSAQDKINDVYELGQEKVSDIGSQLKERARKFPIQSLLIAAGVGFVIGLMRK